MIKKQTIKLMALAALLSSATSYGQTVNNAIGLGNGSLSVPSPNASSLGTYGTIPVSLFSGLPSVEVPLTTLQYRDINIPVKLNYQYRGFRPNEHPGWVGMGWSMESGGAIIRVKKGEADEIKIYNNSYEYGYLYANQRNTLASISSNFNSLMQGQGQKNLSSTTPLIGSSLGYFFDTEPDEFIFSLPGGVSGKFYCDNNGNWVMQSDQNISISINPTIESTTALSLGSGYSIPRYIKRFTLTAQDGTQYTFGGTYSAQVQNMEISRSAPSARYGTTFDKERGNNAYVSAWYLAKIVSPLGNVVNFNYEADAYTAEVIPNFEIEQYSGNGAFGGGNMRTNFNTYSLSLTSTCYLASIVAGDGQKIEFNRSPTTYDIPASASNNWQGQHIEEEENPDYVKLMSQTYINQFDYPDIAMTYDGNQKHTFLNKWVKLDNVKIYNGSDLYREYDFDYYKKSDKNSKTGRLELKNIQLKDAAGGVVPFYSFEYWTLGMGTNPVPYGTRNVDHWGFYNGSSDYFSSITDTSQISLTTANISSIKSQYMQTRESDAAPNITPYCVSGALKRIYYPTGGNTKFEYEVNTYLKVPVMNNINSLTLSTETATKSGGGIRLLRTTSYNSTDPDNNTLSISGPPVVKKYYYVKDYVTNGSGGSSSGILVGGYPNYFLQGSTNSYAYGTDPTSQNNSVVPFNGYCYWTNAPILPLEGNSNHVTYSEVTEVNGDGSFKVNEFNNYDNGTGNQYFDKSTSLENNTYSQTNPSNGLSFRSLYSMAIERGKLLKERYYTSSNQLKRSVSYVYNTNSNRFNSVVNAVAKKGHVFPFQVSGNTYFTLRSYATGYYLYHDYLQTVVITDYMDDGSTKVTQKDLTYDGDRNTTSVTETIGNGQVQMHSYKYCNAFGTAGTGNPAASGLQNLYYMGVKNALVEETVTKGISSNLNVVGGKLYTYAPEKPIVTGIYNLDLSTPVPSTAFQSSSISGGNFTFDGRYNLKARTSNYNTSSGYIYETEELQKKTAYLRDYGLQYVTAKAEGAANADIAYSSFEGSYTGTPTDENNGNWNFTPSSITSSYAFTGTKSISLSTIITSKSSLTAGTRYIVSFWSTGPGTPTITWSGGSTTPTILKTSVVDGVYWTLNETAIALNTAGPITINNLSNVYIDELKLYPAGANLQTYTYDYINGMTSANNTQNQLQFYEYDALGRLILVRDLNRNIVKKMDYKVQKPE